MSSRRQDVTLCGAKCRLSVTPGTGGRQPAGRAEPSLQAIEYRAFLPSHSSGRRRSITRADTTTNRIVIQCNRGSTRKRAAGKRRGSIHHDGRASHYVSYESTAPSYSRRTANLPVNVARIDGAIEGNTATARSS